MVSVAHLGSRPLSLRCLRVLHDHPDVTVKAVVTYPPDHDGWWEGSLYDLATEYGYPVVSEEELFEFNLDYLISTLYFNIIGSSLLNHPSRGGLNLHQAELPRYRGSNTFSHAIMNARPDDYWQYGTTLHLMNEKVDEGDVVAREFVDILEEDTARSLYEKTEQASVELFKDMLPDIVSGDVISKSRPQHRFDGKRYFYTKDSLENEKELSLDELRESPVATYDKVRALDFPPFKPAYITINGSEIHLTKSSYEEVVSKYF